MCRLIIWKRSLRSQSCASATLPNLNASSKAKSLALPAQDVLKPLPRSMARGAQAREPLPMRSMKLLKDWLLMFVSVSFMARAKSARSARCCQRSLSDFSSWAGEQWREHEEPLWTPSSLHSILEANSYISHK